MDELEVPEGVLQHECTTWRSSSQAAANLYRSGVKLWTKEGLVDMERQLANSGSLRFFTVRRIDGTTIHIANPMFGEEWPIWKPYLAFRDYWRLVNTKPDGPPETYHCSYLPKWENTTNRRFRGIRPDASMELDARRHSWITSASCEMFKELLGRIPAIRKVTKIICFGLGDICRDPPEWLIRTFRPHGERRSRYQPMALLQYAIAMTLRETCSRLCEREVQLLTQDPDYTAASKVLLEASGFTIVGEFGAEGFAMVDEETIVFSVNVEAPLKQIIADIARPLVIFETGFDTFNDSNKPFVDAESPRTAEMWRDYQMTPFPIAYEEKDELDTLLDVWLYIKHDVDNAPEVVRAIAGDRRSTRTELAQT